mmetsp:Transcript_60953/g.170495  ORF Transcript_60953/g.170495 Transcript_60953/m.170495 type:complete len:500 (+) Transcript_60953:441-1940(+)
MHPRAARKVPIVEEVGRAVRQDPSVGGVHVLLAEVLSMRLQALPEEHVQNLLADGVVKGRRLRCATNIREDSCTLRNMRPSSKYRDLFALNLNAVVLSIVKLQPPVIFRLPRLARRRCPAIWSWVQNANHVPRLAIRRRVCQRASRAWQDAIVDHAVRSAQPGLLGKPARYPFGGGVVLEHKPLHGREILSGHQEARLEDEEGRFPSCGLHLIPRAFRVGGVSHVSPRAGGAGAPLSAPIVRAVLCRKRPVDEGVRQHFRKDGINRFEQRHLAPWLPRQHAIVYPMRAVAGGPADEALDPFARHLPAVLEATQNACINVCLREWVLSGWEGGSRCEAAVGAPLALRVVVWQLGVGHVLEHCDVRGNLLPMVQGMDELVRDVKSGVPDFTLVLCCHGSIVSRAWVNDSHCLRLLVLYAGVRTQHHAASCQLRPTGIVLKVPAWAESILATDAHWDCALRCHPRCANTARSVDQGPHAKREVLHALCLDRPRFDCRPGPRV